MRLSLQKKFLLAGFLSVTLLTASIGFMAAVKTRDALYAAMEKQGRILAQTVSALIVNELIYEMLGLVEEGGLIDNYMRDLYSESELELNFIAVLDNTRKVMSHSDFGEYGKRYQQPILDRALRRDNVEMRKIDTPDGADALEFAAPLSIEGKHWGLLFFSLSLKSVEEEITGLIRLIASLATVALAILCILIYFLSRRFITPIIDLSHAMSEVDVEMPEKVIPVSGNDEMANLTESFNAMVRRIRRANEEMKITHEKLLQSEKLATLGVLSSSVAHRINNPLGGLFNCVVMLRKKGGESEFRKNYLDLVEEGLESIKQTVGQLLRTAGRDRGEEKHCAVATVLGGVMKFVEYKFKNQNITFTADLEPGLKAALAQHDLEEILLNTIINSIQAMPKGGELLVTGAWIEGKVILSVEDTGTGIPASQIDQVFDLFYSTKDADEGTGLGMWMTYELVKKHKGDVDIISSEGAGTKLIFTLPEAP